MSARVIPLAEVDEPLLEEWRQLARQAREPNPYGNADFVLAAGRHLPSARSAALVVVERDGELRFVLPTVPVRHFRRIPVPAVSSWSHDYSFLGTPLLSGDDPEDVWAEALGAMRDLAPWAVLEQLGSDGPVADGLAAAQIARNRSLAVLKRPERPVLLRRPGTAYLDLLSSSRRSKMRRLRPRLERELGNVQVVDHEHPGPELDGAIDGFLAMEAAGWKLRAGGAMAGRVGSADFFRDVCRSFAEAGGLQMRCLMAGGVPLGYQCNLLAGNALFGFKTTFDEAYRRYSPGVVLVVDTIEVFQATEHLELYDSCMGADPSLLAGLFPDRRALSDVLVSLSGRLGQIATRLTPRAAVAARRARHVRGAVVEKARFRPAAQPS